MTPVSTTGAQYDSPDPAITRGSQPQGVPRSTLYAKVAEGEFPTPIKLGQRSVGWSAAEVEAWIDSRISQRGGHNDDA